MGELFAFIFDGIADRFHHELQVISQQYPFEPLQYLRPALRITFEEGITLLRVSFHLYIHIIVFSIVFRLSHFCLQLKPFVLFICFILV